jgi:hypothetical protein
MFRNLFRATVASAAIVAAAPVLAAPGHGQGGGNMSAPGGGPSQAGINARANSQGPMNASPTGVTNASPNSVLNTTTTPTTNATNSQGLQHASPTAVGHANTHSVLARGAVASTALPGLTTGLTVQTTGGTTLGTVSQVVTGSDGSIRLVVVTSSTGQTLRLAPSTLSISGGIVTTTMTG